jgi:hypothetical protein
MSDIYQGDIGTALQLTITEDGSAVDVSAVGNAYIKLRTPDGRLLTKNATLPNGGTDGLIQYVTQADDLNVPGRWRIQGYLTNLGGWTGHTSEGKPFPVLQVIG